MIASKFMNCAPVFVAVASAGWAQVTQRVSVNSAGMQRTGVNGVVAGTISISPDGRFVAFASEAVNLDPGDSTPDRDVFLRDRITGVTELVSFGSGGQTAISSDARFVAYEVNSAIAVLDRVSGTVEQADVGMTKPAPPGGFWDSWWPGISGDGRFVVFASAYFNFGQYPTSVYVRDRWNGTTQAIGGGFKPSITSDGRYVAFSGTSSGEACLRDREFLTTECYPGAPGGVASISADGRYFVYQSTQADLVPGDTNGAIDVFVRDRVNGTTERVSIASDGTQANDESTAAQGSVSADGRYVLFISSATNLVPGDTNGIGDFFLRDRVAGTTRRVSVDSAGEQANMIHMFLDTGSISADGRYAAFSSVATNLVPNDTNGVRDVFVHDHVGGTRFFSICDPGAGAVIACPCSNPPSGPGRGCDNSAGTGGATLSAIGGAYLSSDSLVLSTIGQRPSGTSIVLQGDALIASGAVFGQGVRCAGGTLKRLYVKSASGGAIAAPNFDAGDPSLSTRSAALGDPIQAAQSRWYTVYYRDPIVLGACPPSSTFDATQTGKVIWGF